MADTLIPEIKKPEPEAVEEEITAAIQSEGTVPEVK